MSNKKTEVIKSKRFVIRQALIGKGAIIEFTNKEGKVFKYDHDMVYEANKARFDTMPCFAKYKTYTNSKTLPRFVREMKEYI